MKAAIYSRKSVFTGKGESIGNQINLCKDYGKKNLGIEEFLVYEDEGFSGGNTNRPKFKQLIKDAKDKKFDVLICYRLDRISRNVADFSSTLELLQENNISFVSIKEQFDTSTPMGKAMVYIASVFAQLERETIAERIRDNMLELAKTGRWLGGQTPLGFKSEKISYFDAEMKERTMYKLSPVEEELDKVKLIYMKYLELKSLRKVTQYLLENNFKSKLGGDFNIRYVSDLLQNPTYVKSSEAVFNYLRESGIACAGTPDGIHGILTYNKKKGRKQYRNKTEWIATVAKHKGIISSDIWLQIQSNINRNKAKAPKLGRTHNALLTGLLKCSKCGSPMSVIHGPKDKNGNKTYFYGCSMKIASKGTRCDNSNIRTSEMESVVINKLKYVTKNTGLLIEELNTVKNQLSSSKEEANELTLLNSKIKSNKQAIESLVKQLSLNPNSTASKYIIEEIEKKEEEIKQNESKIESLKEDKTEMDKLELDLDLITSNLKNFYHTIDNVDIEKKKYLISVLVDKITWNGSTGEVDIKLWGNSKKKNSIIFGKS
ncbi:recombinase family protein [Clostridium botulinum]|uniref:recombinase family protein n=1 Tax=Clostridium botulinum TaxID=1491 RepID=UPI00214739C5|nr:recombinase family protein [Clostridium botulinum]MCR1175576.1 recombinase family protein [Clostridium botulinum]